MPERTCVHCDAAFTSKRSDARFCGKQCARKDYYERNRERELAGMARWREENYEYDRQRWADYADRRWGAEREARQEAQAARLTATDKACTSCSEVKPKSSFHRDPRRVDGLHSWCKRCFHAHVASMRTPEGEAARRRAAYADPARRARLLAKHRRWSRANPAKNRQYARRYQARKRAATIGTVDYGAIIERDGMRCHLCVLDIASLTDLHFDHVVPLSRGGEHSMANVKPAHATCNLRKKDKLVSELDWLPVA